MLGSIDGIYKLALMSCVPMQLSFAFGLVAEEKKKKTNFFSIWFNTIIIIFLICWIWWGRFFLHLNMPWQIGEACFSGCMYIKSRPRKYFSLYMITHCLFAFVATSHVSLEMRDFLKSALLLIPMPPHALGLHKESHPFNKQPWFCSLYPHQNFRCRASSLLVIHFDKYDDITYEDIEEVTDLISEVLATCDRVFTFHPWYFFTIFSASPLKAIFFDLPTCNGRPRY